MTVNLIGYMRHTTPMRKPPVTCTCDKCASKKHALNTVYRRKSTASPLAYAPAQLTRAPFISCMGSDSNETNRRGRSLKTTSAPPISPLSSPTLLSRTPKPANEEVHSTDVIPATRCEAEQTSSPDQAHPFIVVDFVRGEASTSHHTGEASCATKILSGASLPNSASPATSVSILLSEKVVHK